MRWPFRRRLYLTVDNDDSDPRPVGVEELLSPVLKRALMATKATGAAIALNRGKGHHHMPPILLHCLYGFGHGVQPCLTKVHI